MALKSEQKVEWPGWEVVRVIGRGSFGTVYEIHQQLFNTVRKAALKVISIPQNDSEIEELFSEGYDSESVTQCFRDQLEDIVKEFTLMLDLKGNTNVVYCDDVRYIQREDGIGWDIFIQMELLTPLLQSLERQVSEAQVIRIGIDICRALALCKSRNIVHRDIKPQNIFVDRDGNYKLGDFGIAKTVERTTSGTKIGTYNYMAPEVYNNQPYGAAADIYSLGLVLYWLLNDRRMPFLPDLGRPPKVSESDDARRRRFSGEPLPEPKNGSEALKQIVLRACAYEPEDRFASAEEMLAALSALAGTPSAPLPVSAPERKTSPAPEPVPESPEEDGFGPTEGPGKKPEPRQEPAHVPEPCEPPVAADTGSTEGRAPVRRKIYARIRTEEPFKPPIEEDSGPTVGAESSSKNDPIVQTPEPSDGQDLGDIPQKRKRTLHLIKVVDLVLVAMLILLLILPKVFGKKTLNEKSTSDDLTSGQEQQIEEQEHSQEVSDPEDSGDADSPITPTGVTLEIDAERRIDEYRYEVHKGDRVKFRVIENSSGTILDESEYTITSWDTKVVLVLDGELYAVGKGYSGIGVRYGEYTDTRGVTVYS